jgi:hypothetical protein
MPLGEFFGDEVELEEEVLAAADDFNFLVGDHRASLTEIALPCPVGEAC